MSYSLPNATTTDYSGFVIYINNATNGYFGLFILLAAWAISFIGLKMYQTEKAMAVSLFFAMLMSFGLYALGVLQVYWMLACVIGTAIAVILQWMMNN